jgi:hypothetical protein
VAKRVGALGSRGAMPTQPASTALGRALDDAMVGRRGPLYELLARGSGLPGARVNAALASTFAQTCRGLGRRADAVALAMAHLSADEAPGATALEFLPVCGLAALGARAAADEGVRTRFLMELHARADDLRFRVRDAVIEALARIGGATGDTLANDVAPWMDGYFHAAAVVRALAHEAWLSNLHDAGPVVARFDEAFVLARDAPRAAARYPGRKALVEALGLAPGHVAARFGVPVFDMLARWSAVEHPELRNAITATTRSPRLVGRFATEIERVRRALLDALPPKRNPDHDFGPTRDRSGARRRGK